MHFTALWTADSEIARPKRLLICPSGARETENGVLLVRGPIEYLPSLDEQSTAEASKADVFRCKPDTNTSGTSP
jgi:hypothetical protein